MKEPQSHTTHFKSTQRTDIKHTRLFSSKSRFPQCKAALIHHRSQEQNNHHFTPIHLTSHPLQNYPPQAQGRDCWSEGGEKHDLVEILHLYVL